MKKTPIIFFLLVLFTNLGNAAHIIGGKFRATYINSNTIQIQLELERDCNGGGANFETTAIVGVFSKSSNNKVDQISLSRYNIVPASYNYDCNGTVRCVEVGYFSANINTNGMQFNDTAGYYLQWERCCLTDQLSNIVDPGSTPFSALIEIPKIKMSSTDSAKFVNSSPYKVEIFNPLICLNEDFEYDLGFHDIDGDSLVYELITPIAGGYTSQFNPAQNTGPKPYDDVFWSFGYDKDNPLQSSNGFILNRKSGQLKFNPIQLGKHLFAIAIHEYRNGVKIGTVYYESILYVYNCTSAIILQPKEQYSVDYSPVTFHVKHSDSTVTYQWQVRESLNTSFTNILNARADSLVVSNIVDSMNNYQYRCAMHKSACDDISFAARLRIKGLGIDTKNSNKITLFPNPSNHQVNIKGIENPQKISLYSLEGKLLKEIFNSSTFDVSDILPGMYLIRVNEKNNNANYYAKLRVGE